jgi:hypothetical protein
MACANHDSCDIQAQEDGPPDNTETTEDTCVCTVPVPSTELVSLIVVSVIAGLFIVLFACAMAGVLSG